MKKPYTICHMMISIDGRIDCAMTSKLRGVNDYYTTLDEINVPTTVSGRVTAERKWQNRELLSRKITKVTDRKVFRNRQRQKVMKSLWIRMENCAGRMLQV